MMPAQDLPKLANDGSVTVGSLPNGVSYYLVTNSSMKGLADYALVRKGVSDTLSARKELVSLPHFNKTIPYKFLSRKGIACSKDGYISYEGNSTVFSFQDVPLFDQAAQDTTLLMLFDLIAQHSCPHAIVVAGDINPGAIIAKMNVFTMMVPARNPQSQNLDYSFKLTERFDYSFISSTNPSVSISFRTPRTDPAQMSTIVPFISELYSLQLGEIVKERLRETLVSRNIPSANVTTEYFGSDAGPGDPHFVIRASCTDDNLVPTGLAMASVLAELGQAGVTKEEYKAAKEVVLNSLSERRDNHYLKRQCIASYLYGADLASTASKLQFLTSRTMTSDSEVTLFSNYVEALFEDFNNTRVKWEGNSEQFDDWAYPSTLQATWDAVSLIGNTGRSWRIKDSDTLSLWSAKNKSKIKAVESETISGGEFWTFSNGIRVLYKKASTSGRFNYSLMIKGGFASLPGLKKGEGAYFSDLLLLNDIGGMPGEDFQRMLKSNGVEMKCTVSEADMRIGGSAPSSRLLLLMKSLLSIANERTLERSAFEKYSIQEKAAAPAFLDSLMYPNYVYTTVKNPSALSSHTFEIANSYFDRQFLKVNDGVFVIIGDMDPEYVKKVLSGLMDGFRVSKTVASRQTVPYKLGTGLTTYSMSGSPLEISIGMAAYKAFSVENMMAFKVAALALKRSLTGKIAESGFNISMSDRFILYPQESLEIIFKLTPIPTEGLPMGLKGGAEIPNHALLAARKIISDTFAQPINGAELQACKALLLNCYAAEIANQDSYINLVLMRYSYGKDVLTKYQDRVNSVSAEMVGDIYKALSSGKRIEYVVK